MHILRNRSLFLVITFFCGNASLFAATNGYYRQPALHKDTVVFVAEGDLWKVGATGGAATRLTSNPGDESTPAISPDGKTLAFVAQYEGSNELYTMPLTGGLPTRRTYNGAQIAFTGWTPDGKVICSTYVIETLPHPLFPNLQLMTLDISQKDVAAVAKIVPLAQAAQGAYDDDGKTLFFTRLRFQGSHTKRYQGGTAQNIWRYKDGDAEAVPLTGSFAGTSKNPMFWQGRVYFLSDRDGAMNIWSMKPDGSDTRQHTHHAQWDAASPSLSDGRIVYQLGADLRLYEIAADADRIIPITLDSDLDQLREHWVDHPERYISSAHLSADGSRVAITARGQVFVAPRHQGRLAAATHKQGVRCRDARFIGDGKNLLVLSDQSGETEFWKISANGVGSAAQLTQDADVLRWEGVPSPDGKYVAHRDKNQRLFILDVATKNNRKIDESPVDDFDDLAWSPDSRWLAYAAPMDNLFRQIKICGASSGKTIEVTSRRFDSYSPAWSRDGKWLYLLSDRNLKSVVGSPWGTYEPQPFLDKKTQIFLIALSKTTTRSPFEPNDELHADSDSGSTSAPGPTTQPSPATQPDPSTQPAPSTQPGLATQPNPTTQPDLPTLASLIARFAATTQLGAPDAPATQPASVATRLSAHHPSNGPAVAKVNIDFDGIAARLIKAPLPPGNYSALALNAKSLFWIAKPTGQEKGSLIGADISNDNMEIKTIAPDVDSFELSEDGKKILLGKGKVRDGPGFGPSSLFIIDAAVAPADLNKKQVDLSHLALSVIPREEWRAMFADAWRMERDYFYDRNMHGVDWKAMRRQYEPLLDRVTTRSELSDLIAQMVSELGALHTFVNDGPDTRHAADHIVPSSLGAALSRDSAKGGYRVEHIYKADPDEPDWAGPLARFGVNVKEGDVIEMVDGVPTLAVRDIAVMLRQRAGQQVLLHIKRGADGKARDVIVRPITETEAFTLRYHEWEYSRRQTVEQMGKGQIGYLHLRAMGGANFTQWAKGFYPVWNRPGLIIDVRHNSGGNIDSWIIDRLLRKAWSFWSTRLSDYSTSNMQYAFRGHVVVLCDEGTASDGEAFTEGIKRLKIGTVIGTRTWGGEIWLSGSNLLVDRGVATAGENGVYGPEGDWLIEGHGVNPDIVVDNLPHATFNGEDAQLKAAVEYLKEQIEKEPVKPLHPPKYPNKSFKQSRGKPTG
ncbi:MAG TPA: S41 family peptidase [Tepidisphaeraceae bacterium]|nr:S41 family peptidase [Tepidisphaeraceae bacterium]